MHARRMCGKKYGDRQEDNRRKAMGHRRMPAPRGNSVRVRRAGIRACESGVSPSHDVSNTNWHGANPLSFRTTVAERHTPFFAYRCGGSTGIGLRLDTAQPRGTAGGHAMPTLTCFPFDPRQGFGRGTREQERILMGTTLRGEKIFGRRTGLVSRRVPPGPGNICQSTFTKMR